MAVAALSAAGQISPKMAELGWLELPAFSEDPEHFFVCHYTEEYWGRQRNNSLFWDVERQIPIWVAYPLNRELVGRGSRSGAAIVSGPNFMKCRKDVGKSGNENAPERCQRHFSVVLGTIETDFLRFFTVS